MNFDLIIIFVCDVGAAPEDFDLIIIFVCDVGAAPEDYAQLDLVHAFRSIQGIKLMCSCIPTLTCCKTKRVIEVNTANIVLLHKNNHYCERTFCHLCSPLHLYEAEQSYSLGPKDNTTIAQVELHSKFEDKNMYTQCSTSHTVMMHRNMGKESRNEK